MPPEEESTRNQVTMEGRRRRGPAGRVTVVYYLCRHGRHLEHPHLMELTLASPNHALYLRDVIRRLDRLRGKGMAAMYSWSCKRRYKTGFVWHDVSEDDELLPAQGTSEYVLKGSLLPLCHSSSPPADHEQQSVKQTGDEESPAPSRGSHKAGWMTNLSSSSPPPPPPQQPQNPQEVLSPSSSSTTKESDRSNSPGTSPSPDKQTKRGSGGSTPSSSGSERSLSPPSLTPNNKSAQAQSSDAAEHTDGVPTGREIHRTKDASAGRSGTLQSLIRAEALVRRGGCGDTSKRVLLEDDESSLLDEQEAVHSLGTRLKPASLLMRLVACGSTMSTSHHSACGFMRTTHKPQYLPHRLEPTPPSPVLSPLGALIRRTVSESGDSGSCSCRWSMPQTVGKEDEPAKGMPPTSSYDPNPIRVSERQASNKGNSENLGCRSRIVPQIIRMASTEQPTGETLVTITTDNSAELECGSKPSSTTLSRSKSVSDPSAAKARSPKIVSFHYEKHMVKIEER